MTSNGLRVLLLTLGIGGVSCERNEVQSDDRAMHSAPSASIAAPNGVSSRSNPAAAAPEQPRSSASSPSLPSVVDTERGAPVLAEPPAADGRAPVAEQAELGRPVFDKTAGIVEQKREGEPRLLQAVRTATHQGFDRVVFEFRQGVPGFHLEYIDKPVRDCGAGDVKPIAGDGWLEVRFYPALAHTEAGQPTVQERELRPNLTIVREVERTCDFEAVVTWVIGTASPNRYRVFELKDPPRLVVDIDH